MRMHAVCLTASVQLAVPRSLQHDGSPYFEVEPTLVSTDGILSMLTIPDLSTIFHFIAHAHAYLSLRSLE